MNADLTPILSMIAVQTTTSLASVEDTTALSRTFVTETTHPVTEEPRNTEPGTTVIKYCFHE